MNIVLVNPHLGPVLGGIQKDMLCLAREFAHQGAQVTLVTTYDEFPEGRVTLGQPLTYHVPRSTSIVRLEGRFRSRLRNFQPANAPLWLPGLTDVVLRARPDIVIFFNVGWPITVLPALLTLRRRTVVLYRTAYHAYEDGHRLDPLRCRLQLGVVGLAHRLLPYSNFEKQQLVEQGRIAADRITPVYPGVDVIQPAEDEVAAFRARHNLTGKVVVGHVARLSAFKGTGRLIRVLSRVRRQSGRDVVLLLVGRNTEEAYLERLIREQGAGPFVRLTGPVSEGDLHLAYAASDVFALPSRYESFGLVFLEAMAQGVPAVGVRTGGVPEVIREGETGFVLDSCDDLEALAGIVARLVEDDALRTALGRRAHAWVRQQFNWAVAAGAIETVVGELV